MKGYEIGYNLTEEIRQLLDADYKKDTELFEKAKGHILGLLGKELTDIEEYTKSKNDMLEVFFKALEARLKGERTEQTVSAISNDLYLFSQAYNDITEKYMHDVVHELLKYANGKQ